MKLTETLGYVQRASLQMINRFGYLVMRAVVSFLEGAVPTALFLVFIWLMTVDPVKTTFTDFLWVIQSPKTASLAAVGGLILMGLRILGNYRR
jgi:hypothetical protein